MYPDEFPRDAWYVVTHSAEVGERPRRIPGDPVLLSRAADGQPLALADRGAPGAGRARPASAGHAWPVWPG